MKINAVFMRKESAIETKNCVMESMIFLSDTQFKHFSQNLLEDYDFIERNIDNMYTDTDGVQHCILAMNEKTGDGILINSSGSTYARYSSFVPHIKPYIEEQIRLVISDILSEAIFNDKLEIDLEDVSEQHGINIADGSGFINIFSKQLEEISDIENFDYEEGILYLTLDSGGHPKQGMKMEGIK